MKKAIVLTILLLSGFTMADVIINGNTKVILKPRNSFEFLFLNSHQVGLEEPIYCQWQLVKELKNTFQLKNCYSEKGQVPYQLILKAPLFYSRKNHQVEMNGKNIGFRLKRSIAITKVPVTINEIDMEIVIE
ncbi:MAG: hypothetical protein OXB92_17220 [Acidimicrobiaceae bacterium]|nr:hypothetical protein [Acidimicrobiaceae bacterium]